MRPPAIVRFTQPSWRFTFLQHGVIKDDLSHVAEQQARSTCSSPAPSPSTTRSSATTRRTRSPPRRPSSPGCPGSTGSSSRASGSAPSSATSSSSRRPGATGSCRRSRSGRRGGRSCSRTSWRPTTQRNWLGAAEVARAGRGGGATRPHRRLPAAPQHPAGPGAAGPAAARAGAELRTTTTSRSCSRGPRCWSPTTPRSPSTPPTSTARRCTSSSTASACSTVGTSGGRGYFDYVRDGFGPVTTELDDAVQSHRPEPQGRPAADGGVPAAHRRHLPAAGRPVL